MIAPAPMTMPLMPRALPSSGRGKASVTRAVALAISSAPPTPWTRRHTIS